MRLDNLFGEENSSCRTAWNKMSYIYRYISIRLSLIPFVLTSSIHCHTKPTAQLKPSPYPLARSPQAWHQVHRYVLLTIVRISLIAQPSTLPFSLICPNAIIDLHSDHHCNHSHASGQHPERWGTDRSCHPQTRQSPDVCHTEAAGHLTIYSKVHVHKHFTMFCFLYSLIVCREIFGGN